MLLIRVVAFTLAVLLFAETIEPSWGWYLALWVFCLTGFSLVSVAAGFISFWLMIGVFEPSDAWHTVLAVFTLVAVVQGLIRRSAWAWRTERFNLGETSGGRRGWRRE